MEYKICKICGEKKIISDFHKDKTRKDGIRNICKNCCSDKIKKYYKDNKVNISIKNKKWRVDNHSSIIERNKKWKENNLEKYKEIQKKYIKNNKNKIKKYRNKYNSVRKNNDPVYNLKCGLSRTISDTLREMKLTKKSKTCEILGCSYEELKNYLESKFENWMNWDNKGNPNDGILEPNKSWDIDHIIPLSTAKTEGEVIKLNHYTNLQPLCSYINRVIKKDNII
jgi:hypothetical protein